MNNIKKLVDLWGNDCPIYTYRVRTMTNNYQDFNAVDFSQALNKINKIFNRDQIYYIKKIVHELPIDIS